MLLQKLEKKDDLNFLMKINIKIFNQKELKKNFLKLFLLQNFF
jgi:hypothetical protein